MGKIRSEENALWSFAPYDIPAILRLAGQLPVQVSATGGAYLQPNVADAKVSGLLFDRGIRAEGQITPLRQPDRQEWGRTGGHAEPAGHTFPTNPTSRFSWMPAFRRRRANAAAAARPPSVVLRQITRLTPLEKQSESS